MEIWKFTRTDFWTHNTSDVHCVIITAHSVPVDVPTPPNRELSLEAEDSGFSTSFNSNASSLTTSIPTPSSSASMNSNSLTSLQRRWRRNQQTSLEHNILKRQSDEGICEVSGFLSLDISSDDFIKILS